MNKQDLVAVMAEKAELTKAEATRALEAFEYAVGATLADGGSVRLVGFGLFKPIDNAARIARNPKTGAPVDVPAKRKVSFIAGKDLKETINATMS